VPPRAATSKMDAGTASPFVCGVGRMRRLEDARAAPLISRGEGNWNTTCARWAPISTLCFWNRSVRNRD
jgi:hypothetical protein